MGSQGRIEKFMRVEMSELCLSINANLAQKKARTSTNGSSILTKYEEDDRAVWKEFRRELIQDGYDSSFIYANMEHIKAYVKELGARGVLDVEESGPPKESPCGMLEGPVQWRVAQDIWFKSKASMVEIRTDRMGPFPSTRFLKELSRISRMHGVYIEIPVPQQPTNDCPAPPAGTKLDYHENEITIRDSDRRQPLPILAADASSNQSHRDLGRKDSIVSTQSHAPVSGDAPTETIFLNSIQADASMGSPQFPAAATHTNCLPDDAEVSPKKLGQAGSSTVKYVAGRMCPWVYE